jgi:hypothetical protein
LESLLGGVAVVVAEGFEGLEAEFEGEDGGSGLGGAPGGEEEDGGFDCRLTHRPTFPKISTHT